MPLGENLQRVEGVGGVEGTGRLDGSEVGVGWGWMYCTWVGGRWAVVARTTAGE